MPHTVTKSTVASALRRTGWRTPRASLSIYKSWLIKVVKWASPPKAQAIPRVPVGRVPNNLVENPKKVLDGVSDKLYYVN